MTFRLASVIMVLTLLVLPTTAISGVYINGAVGSTQYEYDDVNNGSAKKATIGYRFKPVTEPSFALELSYINGGEADIDLNGTLFQGNNLFLETTGTNFSLAYYLQSPNSNLFLYLQAGAYQFETSLENKVNGLNVTESGSGFSWGVGLGFLFAQHFSVFFDVEGFAGVHDFADDDTVTIMTVGAGYYF